MRGHRNRGKIVQLSLAKTRHLQGRAANQVSLVRTRQLQAQPQTNARVSVRAPMHRNQVRRNPAKRSLGKPRRRNLVRQNQVRQILAMRCLVRCQSRAGAQRWRTTRSHLARETIVRNPVHVRAVLRGQNRVRDKASLLAMVAARSHAIIVMIVRLLRTNAAVADVAQPRR